jgi:cellulose/xylan binding protein with CBM9 domain
MKPLWLLFFLMAGAPGVIVSHHSRSDFSLTADPDSKAWKGVRGVVAANDVQGHAGAGHRTEIRSRWTDANLYFLFICPYETLHLKPGPVTNGETNKLWDWDVAEVFVGADFQHIRQYKEFEVSPQGEWVDLDIDKDFPKPEGGWKWNSGFECKARIDAAKKIWYAEMRIPMESIDKRRPAPGLEMRVNLYRCQGPPPDRKFIAWQPTGQHSFHVPEAFGRLKLE